jgi:Ig-like domain from next to BRCA1 gene
MKKISIPATILLVAAFLLSACGAVVPKPLPTLLPEEMIGTEVVQTSAALATQTALNMPAPSATPRPSQTPRSSETPRESATPLATSSPTAPFVVVVPVLYTVPPTPYLSPTPLQEPGVTQPPQATKIPVYGATVYSQSPANGTVFKPGQSFTASWLFSNDTKRLWSKYEVDFIYWAGEKMYVIVPGEPHPDVVDLPKDVPPNGTVTIPVKMVAPLTQGTYTVTYLLHEGDRYYIKVSLTINVRP